MTTADRKAVVKTEQILAAFASLRSSLESIGVDMGNARLINGVGTGYEILNAPAGVPSVLGNKENALATLVLFTGAVEVVKSYFPSTTAQAEPSETDKAPVKGRKATA